VGLTTAGLSRSPIGECPRPLPSLSYSPLSLPVASHTYTAAPPSRQLSFYITFDRLPPFPLSSAHLRLFAGFIRYGTLCNLVGVSPTDDVPGLPPVDSNDFWSSILIPDANTTGRTELFLSWSCTASSANLTGCDPSAPSIYNTSGDPTANQGPGDMALISNQCVPVSQYPLYPYVESSISFPSDTDGFEFGGFTPIC
jgi:hypothetical protein